MSAMTGTRRAVMALALAWLTGVVPALAQEANDDVTVTPILSDVTRVESWRFFDPGPSGGEPDYSFLGNRISFGVQSFDADLLKTLDRIHSADEAKNAVKAARTAGFDNVSVDLMFALPRQTLAQWRDTLDQALALQTEHISLYSLIVEPGTGLP